METPMWKKKFGHLEVLVPCAGSVIAVAGIAAILGLRINTSYSLPLGLYQVTLDEAAPLIANWTSNPAAVRGLAIAGQQQQGAP